MTFECEYITYSCTEMDGVYERLLAIGYQCNDREYIKCPYSLLIDNKHKSVSRNDRLHLCSKTVGFTHLSYLIPDLNLSNDVIFARLEDELTRRDILLYEPKNESEAIDTFGRLISIGYKNIGKEYSSDNKYNYIAIIDSKMEIICLYINRFNNKPYELGKVKKLIPKLRDNYEQETSDSPEISDKPKETIDVPMKWGKGNNNGDKTKNVPAVCEFCYEVVCDGLLREVQCSKQTAVGWLNNTLMCGCSIDSIREEGHLIYDKERDGTLWSEDVKLLIMGGEKEVSSKSKKRNLYKPMSKYLQRFFRRSVKETKDWAKRSIGGFVEGDKYMFKQGTIPVLLVAHMDTVHKHPVDTIYAEDDGVFTSPQGIGGDDRCGIYMITQIIKDFNCSVLFTDEEEIGGVGAREFAKKEAKGMKNKFKYLIEFDRKGSNDAVFYDSGNEEFKKYIKRFGFKEESGTYTDVVDIGKEVNASFVNLSCGYYNAHTTGEYVNVAEMEAVIKRAKEIISDVENVEQFPYEEDISYGYGTGYLHKSGYYSRRDCYDDYPYDWNYNYLNGKTEKKTEKLPFDDDEVEECANLMFYIILSDGCQQLSEGWDVNDAIVNFMQANPKTRFCDILEVYDDEWNLLLG